MSRLSLMPGYVILLFLTVGAALLLAGLSWAALYTLAYWVTWGTWT